MIAALSIQFLAGSQQAMHRSAFVTGDARGDILENSRILAVQYMRDMERGPLLGETLSHLTIFVTYDDNTCYHEQIAP